MFTRTAPGEDLLADSPPPADVIIVVGAAGEESFGEAFASWAARWREVAQRAGANIASIGPEQTQSGDPEVANGGQPAAVDLPEIAISQTSDDEDRSDCEPNAVAHAELGNGQKTAGEPTDHQRLRETIAALDPAASAPLWVIMMGHGTFSQNVAKFNLRGPDVSADELAKWLEPLSRPLVVVNASSSSGPFINALSGENRVIVTATRSGNEQNYSRFGDYLSQAIGDESADLDHDGEISILEAFLAASAAVRNFYQSSGRIATEHALIDDNGDGLGTPATAFRGTRVVANASQPDQRVDGLLAARISLAPVSARLPMTDQERMERDKIEAQLTQLRAQRDAMGQDDYRAAVLPHLIRLARIYQAAEQREKNP